jgi:SagB-type dehydrogenase family enzyme
MDDLPASIEAYHRRTKHFPQRYAAGPSFIDWDRQPDPFRKFAGARTVALSLRYEVATPSLGELPAAEPQTFCLETLGLFLELALGLSAWKEVQAARWAVRNNPSSGNLHPTEGWLILPPARGIGDTPALYHYTPFEHALEERCAYHFASGVPDNGFFIALSSIPWREAWKYGERAYRYCQLDAGHALGAISYAAACLGWQVQVLAGVGDETLATLLGLDRAEAFHRREEEHPDLIAFVRTSGGGLMHSPHFFESWRGEWSGKANRLSEDHEPWPAVSRAVTLAGKSTAKEISVQKEAVLAPAGKARAHYASDAARVIRKRRSVQLMDGVTVISLARFETILAATIPSSGTIPWNGYPWDPSITLFIFAHRVEGLEAGLYALPRREGMLERLKGACDPGFAWTLAPGTSLPLYALRHGNFQRFAAALCCHQAIAGRSAFSLGMIADFGKALEEDGAWAYRRLFWEAGMIGQVLYLEATAADLSGTGIGCYFDDEMHRLLGLPEDGMAWQSLYHFTIGGGLGDSRISTSPPYAHLDPSRFQ